MVKRAARVGIVAGFVYFAQGALGVSGVALPLYLRDLNWSVADITVLMSIVSFPWILKIVYGVVSDSVPLFGYRRKSYLYLCCFLSALGWVLLGIAPGVKLLIMACLILANFGFAATDVITDGYIVENSTPKTSAFYQSIAWGARSLGAIASGVTGGWLASNLDYRSIFMITASLPVVVLFSLFLVDEEKKHEKVFASLLEPFKMSWRVISQSNILLFMLFLVLMTAPASFVTPFFFYMKESLKFDELFLGSLMSLGWSGALVGSLIYTTISKKITQKRLLFYGVFINVLNSWATLLIAGKTSAVIVIVLGGVLGCLALLPIMSSAAILTHNSKVEGTVFAILMSVYNLGQILFGFIGGKLYPLIGLTPMIIGAGFLISGGLFVVRFMRIEEAVSKPAGEGFA